MAAAQTWGSRWSAFPQPATFLPQLRFLLLALVIALACCRVYSKAGFHGAMGLLMLIPGVNLIMMLTFAFGRWPLEREVRELRKVRMAVHKADDKTLRRAA